MKRIVALVNNEQYERVEAYCKKHKISIYKLVKDLVLERINKKTLDDFSSNA